jgi:L-iditol 2-dehydrogenase
VVIAAASAVPAQELAIRLAGKGGRVNFFGGLPPDSPPISLGSNRIHYDEVSIQGSHGSTPQENREALDMLQRGTVKVKAVITHRFALDQVERAIEATQLREGLKVLVMPQARGQPEPGG